MRRREAAAYIKERYGFGSPGQLAKLAMKGLGPKFYKPSPVLSIYTPEFLDEWALEHLGEARTSFKTEEA